MENFFSKFLDFRKIPNELFILLSIISGVLLFLPAEALKQLNINEFENDYGQYFGIIFLISTGILLIKILKWLITIILKKLVRKKYQKKTLKYLKELDPSEEAVLREFFIANQDAIKMPYDDPTVKNLINKRLIIKISNYGEYGIGGMLFPMKINENIKDKIDLPTLGLQDFQNDDEMREYVDRERPDWALEIDRFKFRF